MSVDQVLLFLGAAIMVGTAAITSSRYGDLPETIPIHFGLDGTVNRYGPRSMAWVLVVNQVVIAAAFFTLYATTGTRGVLVMGVCLLALFFARTAAHSFGRNGRREARARRRVATFYPGSAGNRDFCSDARLIARGTSPRTESDSPAANPWRFS
jgi:hypothetical protein